jgi:hypothetical protein
MPEKPLLENSIGREALQQLVGGVRRQPPADDEMRSQRGPIVQHKRAERLAAQKRITAAGPLDQRPPR